MGFWGKLMTGAVGAVKTAVKSATKVVCDEIKEEIKNEFTDEEEKEVKKVKQVKEEKQEKVKECVDKPDKPKAENASRYIKVYNFINDLIGDNYQDVKDALEAYGFTNISFVAKKDLKRDLKKSFIFSETNDFEDGEVEKISINGDIEFTKNDKFLPTDRVVIVYHTYKVGNQ